jgi:predicted DNA-binding transcriptional regulator YafY
VNPIERALAILLLLTRGRLVAASELAARFSVSVRTIYRDIDRLIGLGVPVEAERGIEGGYRLPGDFLAPPIALNRVETTALLVALSLVRGLRATPLKADLESAEAKLLAALPRAAREILASGERIVGIERRPDDIFHNERPAAAPLDQRAAVDRFLDGVLKQRRVELLHRPPGKGGEKRHEVEPHGLLLDRDLWYLVGHSLGAGEMRMWRADRVVAIEVTGMAFRPRKDFDIRAMLGRQWLDRAMRTWERSGEGTRIRVSAGAAERLKRDWYYRHAAYSADGDGFVIAIPDTDPGLILPLVRWLGSEAEILSPPILRDRFRGDLEAIAKTYG